ncbi:response regulator [Paraburkholderia bannensis]|uniref:response regulator n=1 Tax=Paraburkholderia bannensis TaxID=765414 RepID=UPI000487F759|nr:response regulator [Paraburkholderia bannensis]
MSPTTLLLIDDHPLFRRGLADYFNASGEFVVVGEASSGQQGIALAGELQPSMVLIDLHMPGLGGLAVLDELRQLGMACRKVVLTASMDRAELLAALKLGAHGYMLKESEPEALLGYVRNCANGMVAIDESVRDLLADAGDIDEGDDDGARHCASGAHANVHVHAHAQAVALAPSRRAGLTGREAQTLALIAQGMSNKLIARQLCISEGTVKVYVKNLLRKLDVRSRLELAASVHRDALARH